MRRLGTPILMALLLLLAWTTVVASAEAGADDTDPIEGVWVTSDGDGWVEIRRQDDRLLGVIIGGPDGGVRLDENNPDPALRDRKLTGLTILQGFEADGPGRWVGGTIYDPDNGKTYRCTLELKDEKTLKVRGYIGVSLFGRTEIWPRRSEEP